MQVMDAHCLPLQRRPLLALWLVVVFANHPVAGGAGGAGVAAPTVSLSIHGCRCKPLTVDWTAHSELAHSWIGCCGDAGWCDVEPGCAAARQSQPRERYAGWDVCLPGASCGGCGGCCGGCGGCCGGTRPMANRSIAEPQAAEAWRCVLFVLGVAGGAVTSYCALQDSTVRAYPSTTAVVGEVLREQTTSSVTLAIWASFFVAYGHLVVISCRLTSDSSPESAAVNRTQRWGFHFLALIIAVALSVPWLLAFKRLPPATATRTRSSMLLMLKLPGTRSWALLGAVILALSCCLWLRAAWLQDGSPFATWLTCFMFFNALTWCENRLLTPFMLKHRTFTKTGSGQT